MNLYTPEQCGRKIDQIKRIGTVLQREIHVTGVSTLAHARDHGDVTLIARLLSALPNGQRVKALAFWFSHFSNKKLSCAFKDGAWAVAIKKDRTASDFDVEGAMVTTFADLTNEKSPTTLTVEQIAKYLERKANEDGLNDDGSSKVAPEARAFCARLLAFSKASPSLQADLRAA
jgi:hypothetical protein